MQEPEWGATQRRPLLGPVLSCPPQYCEVGGGGIKSQKPQGMKALQKELEQFAEPPKQKRITLVYNQADMGLTLDVLFGKVFSFGKVTISCFEVL